MDINRTDRVERSRRRARESSGDRRILRPVRESDRSRIIRRAVGQLPPVAVSQDHGRAGKGTALSIEHGDLERMGIPSSAAA